MELKRCPFCGGEANLVEKDGLPGWSYWRVVCGCCLIGTEEYPLKSAAIKAWNRRDEPPNPPLTLDELREMDGEPVWLKGNGLNQWYIFAGLSLDGIPFFTPEIGYGKQWTAYRRRPEEEK